MDPKLAQDLSSIDYDPLFLAFLELHKAYNNVNRDRLLQTLEGYGTGTCMHGHMETFWAHQKVVLRHNGYHGSAFRSIQGTAQGGLVSLILFNVVIENVIRTCLDMTVEYQRVAYYGLGEAVGWCLGVFYSGDDMIESRDPDWTQHSMNVLVGLF